MDDNLFEDVQYDESLFEEEEEKVAAPPVQKEMSPIETIEQIDIGYTGPKTPEESEAARQGMIEGVPFLKHGMAAYQAVSESGFSNFGENFESKYAGVQDEVNKAKQANPQSFAFGQLMSGLAAPVKGLGTGITYAGLEGASMQEKPRLADMIYGGAVSAATAGVVTGIAPAIQAVSKKLRSTAARTTKEAIHAGNDFKKLNAHIEKSTTKGKSFVEKEIEWAERIQNTTVNGEPLLGRAGQGYDKTIDNAKLALEYHKERLGKVVKNMDEIIDPIDSKSIAANMKSRLNIAEDKLSNNPDTVAIALKREKIINETFQDVSEEVIPMVVKKPSGLVDAQGNPILVDEVVESVKKTKSWKKMKPSEVQRLKLDRSRSADVNKSFNKKDAGVDDIFEMEYNRALTEVMEETNSIAAKTNPELANEYYLANRDYGDMSMVNKLATDARDKKNQGAWGMLARAIGVRGLLVAQVSSTTGSNIVISTGLAAAADQMIRQPSTPQRLAKGLFNLAKLANNRGAAALENPLIRRVVVAANLVDSSPESIDHLKKATSASVAQMELMQSPIKRNINDIKNKSDQILELATFINEDMAGELRTSLHDGDDEKVRVLLDQISKMPEAKNIFEQGEGIDGRIFDPADIQRKLDELWGIDVSHNQKLRLEKALKDNGTIPVIQQEPDRFLDYRKRDKDKPRY